MNGDPNLDLNWLRTQGKQQAPYADWISDLLARRQALLERIENNRETTERLSNLCDEHEVTIAELQDELRKAKGQLSGAREVIVQRDAEILSLYRKLDALREAKATAASSAMGPLHVHLPAYPTYGSDR